MPRVLLSLALCIGLLTGLSQAIAVGETATFAAKSDGASSYEWTFPGGITKAGATVTHVFDTGGQFPVTLKVTGSDGQTNEVTKNVTIQNGDRPTAVIDSNPRASGGNITISSEDNLRLQPDFAGQDSQQLEYFWHINGQISNRKSLDQSDFPTVGLYQVRLTVNDKNQTHLRDEVSLRVIVENQAPEVSSMSVRNSNAGQTVRVRANAQDPDGEIDEYRFEVIENGRSILTQIVNQPEASFNLSQFPGQHSYQFRVTVSDERGRTSRYDHPETLELNNQVENNAPEFELVVAPGNEGVPKQWFNFLADATDSDGDALRYQWIMPDGQQYFSSQVRYQFLTGGPQTVRIRVSDGLETVEDSIVINITEPPNTAPEVSITGVNPAQGDTSTLFRFNAQGHDEENDRLTYLWDMGDGGQAISSTPTYRYSTAGQYNVTVEVSDGRETTRDQLTVEVGEGSHSSGRRDPADNNLPAVAIEALPAEAPVNQTIRFVSDVTDADADPLTYYWEMGDGVRYFTPQVSHPFRTPGTYEVSLNVNDGYGSTVATTSVTISEHGSGVSEGDDDNQIPQVRILSVTPQLSGVVGTVFRFYTQGQDADGDQLRYLWDMGDGQQMFIQNPAYRYDTPGTYTVQVQADDGIDQASDEVTINIVEETEHSSGDLSGSEDSDPRDPTTNTPPSLSITAVAPSTQGNTSTLFRFFTQANDAEADPLNYDWDMGDGTTISGPNPVYRFDAPGTYLVIGTVDDGLATGSAEVTVTVDDHSIILNNPEENQPPTAEIIAKPLAGDLTTTFLLEANATEPDGDEMLYTWNMGDGQRYFTRATQHQYEAPGEYEISLEVSDGVALSRVQQTLTVVQDLSELTGETSISAEIEAPYVDLGAIEQAEFGISSCTRFVERLSAGSDNQTINFASAQISLRIQMEQLRSQINFADLSPTELAAAERKLKELQTQSQFIAKWQAKTLTGAQPLISIRSNLDGETWDQLIDLDIEPATSIATTQNLIARQIAGAWSAYQDQRTQTLKAELQQLLSLRTALSAHFSPSDDKPTLDQKAARLQALQTKWQSTLDFTTDPDQEQKLENDIASAAQLLALIQRIEANMKSQLIAEALEQQQRCISNDPDQALSASLQGLNFEQVSLQSLINGLSDVEGTPETNFFLYAKASEIYHQNALLFEWDLGDSRTAVGQNIYLQYLDPGLYEVTLKVSDELTSSQDHLRIRVYEIWPH